MISISTAYDYSVPIEEQIEYIVEAGFSHVSLGGNLSHFDFLDHEKRLWLLQLIEKHKLEIDTVHGKNLDATDSVQFLERALVAAGELRAHAVVVHPVPFQIEEIEFETKKRVLKGAIPELTRLLGEHETVDVAIENVMPGASTNLIEVVLDALDAANLGFCYDSSHEQIDGPRPYALLSQYSQRTKAVHLSDRTKEFVDHQVPGEGFIDFERIAADLRKIGSERPIVLEVMMTNSRYKGQRCFLRESCSAARTISRKIHGS